MLAKGFTVKLSLKVPLEKKKKKSQIGKRGRGRE